MMIWIKKVFFSDKKIKRLLWAAVVFAIIISGWRALTLYSRDMSVFVRLSMKSADAGTAVLYYDVGRQFNDKHVSTSSVDGDSKFHNVKLKIPFNKVFYHLRFDPPSTSEDEIVVNKVDVVDHYGRILHDFELDCLKPANQIKKFDLINGNIHFSTDEKANDPQISIIVDRPISFNRLQLLALMLMHRVVPEFIFLFLFCVLLIYVWSRWVDPVIATMVIIAILAAGWMFYNDYQSAYFKLTMKTAVKGETAELFYDQGYGLSEEDVVGARIHGDDLFHDYTLKIPRNISHLRLDPLTAAGTVVIKKMEITDRFGNVLKSFAPDQLSPAWEIKSLESLDEGVKVTTEDKALDPQIKIIVGEEWIQQRHPRRFLFAMTTLIEWSLIFAFLILNIYTWKRYKEKICHFIDDSYFQEKLPVIYLGCALGLILAMAVISGIDVHPDELGHENCANYYSEDWLPPSIDNPKMLKTISGFGISYLFRLEIVYLLAGKVALVLSGLVNDNYLRLRLFNVILFFILVLIAARKIRSVPVLVLALVVSPQIWYIFSYFNGDAFVFFISLLLSSQIINSDSLINQYLNSNTVWNKWSGGVFFGILIGLMLISKMNYYIYIVFILTIVAWNLLFERGFANWDENRLQIKKWALVACVALCIYLPPMVYDQYINDFKKDQKISKFVEKHALYEFKPSTVMNAPDDSYPGMNLKSKGVSLQEIFLEKSYWRKLSFLSFFGVYSHMNLYADSNYYETISLFLFCMILFIYFYAAYTITPTDGIALCIVLLFLLLVIGQSVYVSWAGDFEPQGRYLFPMIPMILVGISRLAKGFQKRTMPFFNLVLFMFSMISFVFYALLYIQKVI